jgi:hypothetical protein
MHEMKSKRPLDVCVISDLHLGTYGCHAKQLNSYLKSIEPKTLSLDDGDDEVFDHDLLEELTKAV